MDYFDLFEFLFVFFFDFFLHRIDKLFDFIGEVVHLFLEAPHFLDLF